MLWIITKYLITAVVVVLVSELAKRSDKLGALVAALPMVTILTLIWLHVEKQPATKVANHAWYTFWYVVPTLPMFLVFPHALCALRILAGTCRVRCTDRCLFRHVCGICQTLRHFADVARSMVEASKVCRRSTSDTGRP
jgi:hypothetical protein